MSLLTIAATVAATLTFQAGPCPYAPEAPACYEAATRTVHHPAPMDRLLRLHEIGHAVDVDRLTDGERNRFTRYVRGLVSGPWDREDGRPGVGETFAEAFAICAAMPRRDWGGVEAYYGYSPTDRQHRRICRFILRAAR